MLSNGGGSGVPKLRTAILPSGSPLSVEHRNSKSADLVRQASEGQCDFAAATAAVDEELRPVTASSAVSSVASGTKASQKPRSRGGKKPLSTQDANRVLDGHELGIGGWGDFDTDRLLSETAAAVATRHGEENDGASRRDRDDDDNDDDGDGQEDHAQRQQRLDALARRNSSRLAAHSANAQASKEPPVKQVLRQKTFAVTELEIPDGAAALQELPLPGAATLHRPAQRKTSHLIAHRRVLKGKRPKEDSANSDSGGGNTYLPKIGDRHHHQAATAAPAIGSSAYFSPRNAGLFGPHIQDSMEMRARIFQHLVPIWAVTPGSGSTSGLMEPEQVVDGKSPFECSMVFMKICKTIGISLNSSLAPDVWISPSWTPHKTAMATATTTKPTHKSHVDYDSFCDFVVRNAVQPALHHFHLDHDVDAYIHTVDTIVHSLLICEGSDPHTQQPQGRRDASHQWTRLRELREIQPMLPHWKKGIQVVQKQAPPLAKPFSTTREDASPSSGDSADSYSSFAVALPVTPPLSTSMSGSAATKKLPASEARALQDANIRRKIQLRKSWQPRVMVVEQPQQQLQQSGSGCRTTSKSKSTPLDTEIDSDGGGGDAGALGSCFRVEAVVRPTLCASPHTIDPELQHVPVSTHNNNEEERLPEEQVQEEAPCSMVLLCGSCTQDREATLWCSACFAVYCHACWTSTHRAVVDMASVEVDNQSQTTANKHLPALTSRPMNTHRSGGGGPGPPIAMVYLPSKPIVMGKLQRGNQFHHVNHKKAGRPVHGDTDANDPETDASPSGSDDEREAEGDHEEQGGGGGSRLARAFSSHSILPAIKPSRQQSKQQQLHHHRSEPVLLDGGTQQSPPLAATAMDATANLLKALMLGTATSASILGSSSPTASGSSLSSTSTTASINTKRVYADPAKRKKLYPAAVTLDANELLRCGK